MHALCSNTSETAIIYIVLMWRLAVGHGQNLDRMDVGSTTTTIATYGCFIWLNLGQVIHSLKPGTLGQLVSSYNIHRHFPSLD